MTRNAILARNAVASVIQVVVAGVVLFLLYGFLLRSIGIDLFGVWSLVFATTSITQLVNLGISGGVIKFVAKYIALEDDRRVSRVIQTGTLTTGSMTALAIVAGYPLLTFVLAAIVPHGQLQHAKGILPLALISLWFGTTAGIFLSALDGYQRMDLRSYVMSGGVLFHFFLCLLVVPRYGLPGLAWSSILQNLLIFAASWIVLKSQLRELPLVPFAWDRKVFREIIGYGINLQIVSATTLLCEPTTKALLSKFGGLPMVGYYEMASRMVQQFRALLVAGNQTLVPAFAGLREKAPGQIISVYLSSYQLIFYLALPMYSAVIVVAPLISYLWIGHYEISFVVCVTLLAVGWFFNTLGVPSYFANLGGGELRWNVISHITIAVINLALGVVFGRAFGGFGVVVGWIVALALGSSLIYVSYHLRHQIAFRELLPAASRTLIIICIFSAIGALIAQKTFPQNVIANRISILITGLFSTIVLLGVWFHPMRKAVMGWRRCL